MKSPSPYLTRIKILCSLIYLLIFPFAVGNAADYNWNVTSGTISVSDNWNPSAIFSNSSADSYFISGNRSGVLNSSLALAASTFAVGVGNSASALTIQNGGTLGVSTLVIARDSSQTGPSTVVVQNGGAIVTSITNIGLRSTGSLLIEGGGTFNTGGDTRIGHYGPDFGPGLNANGTVTNRGVFTTSNVVYFSEAGGISSFVNDGGTTTARIFDLDNGLSYASRSAGLSLLGSTGAITLTGAGTVLSAATNTASLTWMFDAGGIVEITLSGASAVADLTGAVKNFNLDAASNGTYTLIDSTNGGSVVGWDVGTVNFLGSKTGTLFTQNGDLLITVIPEPSIVSSLLLGVCCSLLALRRKFNRQARR